MTKTLEKFIDFGTGVDQVSSHSIPANYTPTNYTPEVVASEPATRTSAHLKGMDTKLGLLSSGGAISESFQIAAETAVLYPAFDFTASTEIELYINGTLQEPGALNAYTTEHGANAIYFTENLPVGVWVIVKFVTTYLEQYNYNKTTPQTVFQLSGLTDDSSMQVYVEGILQEEGATKSFTRDTGNDTIIFSEELPAYTWVHISKK